MRTKFSQSQVNVLKSWLERHADHPYPTSSENRNLARLTGLTESQIQRWFTNSRKRGKHVIERPPLEDDVVEEWLASSSEDEEVAKAASRAASRESSFSVNKSWRNSSTRASSASSMSSANSAFSQSKHAVSKVSFKRGSKKHGRYAMQGKTASISPVRQHGQGNFQCTFCSKRMNEKSWKRHEETQHLPRTKWVCQNIYEFPTSLRDDGSTRCLICPTVDPMNDLAFLRHDALLCSFKTAEECTFYRKDHLAQHFRNVHNSILDDASADLLKVQIDYSTQTWTCGFCGERLATWDIRARHIAAHFRQGRKMTDWDSFRNIPKSSSDGDEDEMALLSKLAQELEKWKRKPDKAKRKEVCI